MTVGCCHTLSGRTALVTGAAGGIGSAAVRALVEAGATVLRSDRAGAADCIDLPADLEDAGSAVALAQAAWARNGGVDILVHSAGIHGPSAGVHDGLGMQRLIAVNLLSAVALTGELAPRMAKRGRGAIVFVASIAGVRGNGRTGPYGVSKAGLVQHARDLAVEWGPRGVRANSVSPGLIRTPFAEVMLADEAVMDRRLSLTPLRRVGEAAEVGAAILFLASDMSSFVTGHNLVVDGGTVISDGT